METLSLLLNEQINRALDRQNCRLTVFKSRDVSSVVLTRGQGHNNSPGVYTWCTRLWRERVRRGRAQQKYSWLSHGLAFLSAVQLFFKLFLSFAACYLGALEDARENKREMLLSSPSCQSQNNSHLPPRPLFVWFLLSLFTIGRAVYDVVDACGPFTVRCLSAVHRGNRHIPWCSDIFPCSYSPGPTFRTFWHLTVNECLK